MKSFLLSIALQNVRCAHLDVQYLYHFNGSSTNCNDTEIEKYIRPGEENKKGEEHVKMT